MTSSTTLDLPWQPLLQWFDDHLLPIRAGRYGPRLYLPASGRQKRMGTHQSPQSSAAAADTAIMLPLTSEVDSN